MTQPKKAYMILHTTDNHNRCTDAFIVDGKVVSFWLRDKDGTSWRNSWQDGYALALSSDGFGCSMPCPLNRWVAVANRMVGA